MRNDAKSLLNNTNFNTTSVKTEGERTAISVFFVTSQPKEKLFFNKTVLK